MAVRTIILNVEESKADDLVKALGERSYIDVVPMDREGRKRLRTCPCCNHRLSKEISYTIDEKMAGAMLGLVQTLRTARTVILVNKDNPREDLPLVEKDRACDFDHKLLVRAEALGLIKPFMDGSRKTYFTDAIGFFLNEDSHSPCCMITLDGEVIETTGSMFFDEVKFKDPLKKDRIKKEFEDAIKAIPEKTITFVKNGQMSLV